MELNRVISFNDKVIFSVICQPYYCLGSNNLFTFLKYSLEVEIV